MAESLSFLQRNRKHWDDTAATYTEKQWAKDIVKDISDAVKKNKDWIGLSFLDPDAAEHNDRRVRILDYACGPGNIASALFPYVTQVRGIDVSPKMVEEFNQRAKATGLSPEQIFATEGDLTADPASQPAVSGTEFFDFDIVTCSMAFHHIDDSELVTKRLVERLKPCSGVLLIIDLVPDGNRLRMHSHNHGPHHGDDHGQEQPHRANSQPLQESNQSPHGPYPTHPADATIAHQGFTRERMEGLLKEAGCVDVDYQEIDKELHFGAEFGHMRKKAFMVRGRRGK
ncbi:hypothetical protein MMC13_003093 [Lambiella insularis]|nr:hypothetical protein [Lambiella insularis]